MQTILMLLAAHFIADFSLQPKYMIEDKMENNLFSYLTLLGHCFTHAFMFAVMFIFLGYSNWFGLTTIIFVTHFLIDTGKINHLYNVYVDQLLHMGVILCVSLLWM